MSVETSAEIAEVTPSHKSFDEQFKNPQFVEVNGARVKIVNLIPEHPASNIPLFLAPGWSETTTTHKNTLKHIFAQNHQVISLDHPRLGGTPSDQTLENAKEAVNAEDISRSELHKAQNIIAAIEASGAKRVDTITHSEGSINVALAASLRPDLFKNIVFVSPAGMLSNDNLAKEFGRYGAYLSHQGVSISLDAFDKVKQLTHIIKSSIKRTKGKETKPYREKGYQSEKSLPTGEKGWAWVHPGRDVPNPDTPRPQDINFLNYVGANPKRTLAEAQAIAKADIIESISRLQELGIGISIIHGVDDKLEPIKATFKAAEVKGKIDPVTGKHVMPTDSYYSVIYGHDSFSRDARFVNAALDALKGLAKKPDSKQVTP